MTVEREAELLKALEWVVSHYTSAHWITDVARAALEGRSVDEAIEQGKAAHHRYLHGPTGPTTLDGAYSQMGSGFGGRGR